MHLCVPFFLFDVYYLYMYIIDRNNDAKHGPQKEIGKKMMLGFVF